MELNIKEITEQDNKNNAAQVKHDVCLLLLQKKKDEATERIVKLLENKTKFYATQFDEANEIYYYETGIYKPEGRSFIKKFCRELLEGIYTEQLANLVCAKIEADSFIEQREFFKPQNINEVCVLNGVLNLKTRKLTDYTPNKIFFSKINAFYDPAANCEEIEKFLSEVLAEPNDIITIYEIVGSCLYRDYFIEKAIMMLGTGRNGKGKTISLIKSILGEQNFTGIPLQNLENGDFKEIELQGKLANLGGDISNYPLKSTAKFKGLTGRDMITASKKFKNDVSFVNYAKMIFATNNLPKTYDLSDGFFGRWVYLDFPYQFKAPKDYEEAIKNDPFNKKIRLMDAKRIDNITTPEQLSGLLNRALDGLDNLFKNGDYTSSKSSESIKIWWVRNSDSFLGFCWENLENTESEVEWISKDNLRQKYQKFCSINKLISEGDKHIHEIMVREMKAWEGQVVGENGERMYIWRGVKFKGSGVNV